MQNPETRIEIHYGESHCEQDAFRITRTCDSRPSIFSPEYLLAQALYKDRYLSSPHELTLLLKTCEGPNNPVKAAGVSPTNWEGILYLATFTDETPLKSSCACLLPFAPNVSALAALGKEKVCIESESLDPEFLSSLIHTLIATGTREIILLNPPYIDQWNKLQLKGLRGYKVATAEKFPKGIRAPILTTIDANLEHEEVYQTDMYNYRLPEPRKPPNMLSTVFPGNDNVVSEILQELESTGHVMSYRSFLDIAREMLPQKALDTTRRLILYGYIQIRQGQVELTRKGLYVLSI